MPEAISLSGPLENLGLQHMDEEQLRALLIDRPKWSAAEHQLVVSAYDLAKQLHQDDIYKDQPYIYHLLRVANRITGYLRVHDAELVAAALLHDSVEDHSPDINGQTHNDPALHQQQALAAIASRFSPRVSELVAVATNEADRGEKLSQEEKIRAYTQKVEQAASTVDGWIIKFCDWCDNGVGITHAIQQLSAEQITYFQHKYGGDMLAILEKRFHDPDIQAKLDDFAKGYVVQQLRLGHERLADNESIAEEKTKRGFFGRLLHTE